MDLSERGGRGTSPSSPPQGATTPSHHLGVLPPRSVEPDVLLSTGSQPYLPARSTSLLPPPPPLYTGPGTLLSGRADAPATYHGGSSINPPLYSVPGNGNLLLPGGYYGAATSHHPSASARPTDPRAYYDPDAFHASCPTDLRAGVPATFDAGSSTDPSRLVTPLYFAPRNGNLSLPGGYYGAATFHHPPAYYDPAVRPTPTDPRDSRAPAYSHFGPGDLVTTSSTSLGLGEFLGQRMSEALRLGVHPPPPIEATAVTPEPMTWVVGASTGQYMTPCGPYRPGSWPSTSSTPAPAIHTLRKSDETRMKLLQGNTTDVAVLIVSASSAGDLIGLLEEGDEESRLRLLEAVKMQIHMLMEHLIGSNVFGALLRACKGHPDDLRGVVQAFTERNDAAWRRWIVRRAKDSDDIWLNSLQRLFTAVSESEHTDLCELLLKCLVRENVACSARGAELLKTCFAIFPYDQAKFLIQQAVEDMKTNLHQSHFGSIYLQDCFCHAKGDELAELEEFVLDHAREFAMGQYSTYLLQHGLKYGTYEFLFSVLCLFLDLEEPELGELVTGRFSNFALHTVLDSGRRHFPDTARRLAEKIRTLPDQTLNHANGRLLMRSIREAE